MHVIEVYPVVPVSPPLGLDDAVTSLEEKATAAMEALIETAAESFEGAPLTTEVTRGRAYVEILNRARDYEADLIVLGRKDLPCPKKLSLEARPNM
jgi:nucleotide-binding universal stress UspA family protein